MAKMIDVAKRAGVSIKTVSRVMNNEPHVKDALREQVKAAAREVGYVPSTSARQLRSNRSYTIHMISHSNRSNYVNAIQFGAVQACQDRGYQFMISLMPDMRDLSWSDVFGRIETLMKVSKPDGVILVPPLSNDDRLNEVLSEFDVLVARVGPHDIAGSAVNVRIDEREAARKLTEHLISLGHTRIAFQRGKEDQNATHERFSGYRDALTAAGLEFDPGLVLPGTFDFSSGLEAGDQLLRSNHKPSAVFAANDDMAAGIVMAAHRIGVKVPEDVSVVGFDDSEVADRTWPGLTTVRQPLLELGDMAANRLIDLAHKNASDQPDETPKYLEYEIIHRESAGPALVKSPS